MKRYSRIFLAVAMAGFLFTLTQGCAGKKDSAGAGAGSGGSEGSDSGISESDAEGGDTGRDGMPIVYFDFDQYSIRSQDQSRLKSAADMLQKEANARLTIEGHCDERGSVEYNLALGERRARAVKSYLQKLGVDSKRLNTISYGEERPATTSSDEGAWSKNRRAELITNR